MILAANHRSFLDSIFLPLVLRRRVTFVAKAEYFDDPKTAWFFRAVGQIPIRREGGSAAEGALDAATDVLERGGSLRHLPRGHPHARRATCTAATPASRGSRSRTGAPIVPVGLVGTDECQPTDKKLPRLFRTVVDPLRRAARRSSTTRTASDDRLVLRQITDELMYEIRELSRLRVRRHLRDQGQPASRSPTASPEVSPEPRRCASRRSRG